MANITPYIPFTPDILKQLDPLAFRIYSSLEDARKGVLSPGTTYSFQLTRGIDDSKPFRVDINGDGRTIRELFCGSKEEMLMRDYFSRKYDEEVSDPNSNYGKGLKKVDKDKFVNSRLEDLAKHSDIREELFICDIVKQTIEPAILRVGFETPWYGSFMHDTRYFIEPKHITNQKNSIFIHYHPFQESPDSDSLYDTIRPSFADLKYIKEYGLPIIIFTNAFKLQRSGLQQAPGCEWLSSGNTEIYASSVHVVLNTDKIEPYSPEKLRKNSYVGNHLQVIPPDISRHYLRVVSEPPFYPWESWRVVMKAKKAIIRNFDLNTKQEPH